MKEEQTNRFKKIRDLVAKNELKAAFKNFAFATEKFDIPREIQRDLILIKNELSRLEKEKLSHVISRDHYDHRMSSSIMSLLLLLERCEDYLAEQKQDYQIAISGQKLIPPIERQTFLVASNISKAYPDFTLKPVSFQLDSHSILAVIGKNASGKSTLLRLLAGEEKCEEGFIEYFGEREIKDWYELKKKIGYIPQKILPTSINLMDILKFQCVTHDIPLSELDYYIQDAINKMDLENEIHKNWKNLSGGFQMRFELAKTIIWRPQILIMDEPLANLDIVTQRLFLQDIRAYADSTQYPISIIITSQHIEEIESIADRVIFLDEGDVLFNGTLSELSRNRSFNYYEIGIPNEQQKQAHTLIEAFHEDIILVQEFFDILTLKVPIDFNITEILNALNEAGVKFNYFRDITFSTRRLFSTRKKVYSP